MNRFKEIEGLIELEMFVETLEALRALSEEVRCSPMAAL